MTDDKETSDMSMADPQNAACWNRIGVAGDRRCERLAEVVHCRNCDRYAAAGRALLDRPAPEGYRQQWTDLLAEEKQLRRRAPRRALVFRLRDQWMAISMGLVDRVAECRTAHRIPHQGPAIAGLVNVEGRLHLCVDLAHLLRLDSSTDSDDASLPRLVILRLAGGSCAFLADEVSRILAYGPEDVRSVPETLSHSPHPHSDGMVTFEGRNICLLADELLAGELKRSLG